MKDRPFKHKRRCATKDWFTGNILRKDFPNKCEKKYRISGILGGQYQAILQNLSILSKLFFLALFLHTMLSMAFPDGSICFHNSINTIDNRIVLYINEDHQT